MNYMWLYPTLRFFSPSARTRRRARIAGRPRRAAAARIRGRCSYALQNLLDSHDTGRILTLLENACPPFPDWDSYFNCPARTGNPELKTTRPRPASASRRCGRW